MMPPCRARSPVARTEREVTTVRLTHWAGPIAVLLTLGTSGPEAQTFSPATYAARRNAILERLGPQLMIVPSQAAFKADDQALFLQAANFQYLVGESPLVGAVLVLDGQARSSALFLAPRIPVLTRPQLDAGAESARSLAIDAVLPIADLEEWLREKESLLREALRRDMGDARVAAIEAEVDRDLSPYASRMPARVLSQIRTQSVARRILEVHGLRRLSLFHL